MFTGSSSPVYHQLNWFETDINPTSIATVKTDGDSEAGRLPSNWDRAIVMAVGRRALEFSEACRSDSQEAVAFVSRGVVNVGLLPKNVHFGFGGEASDKATAAMRQGRKPIEATMGRWVEEEGRLVIPPDLERVAILVPIMWLPQTHHTTPLF